MMDRIFRDFWRSGCLGFLLILIFTVFAAVGCGGGGGGSSPNSSDDTPDSVTDDSQVTQIIENGRNYYNTMITSEVSTQDASIQTAEWYKQQSGIEDAYVAEDGANIFIEHMSGLTTVLIVDESFFSSTTSIVPVEDKSVMTLKNNRSEASLDTNIRALVMDPYEFNKDPVHNWNEGPIPPIGLPANNSIAVKKLFERYLNTKDDDDKVTYLSGSEVTPETFQNLGDYDLIYLISHGVISSKKVVTTVGTGEPFSFERLNDYAVKLGKKEYVPNPNGITSYDDAEDNSILKYIYVFDIDGEFTFSITSDFVKEFSIGLNATAVYFDACQSMEIDAMALAFIGNGADNYLGWSWYSNPTIFSNTDKIATDFFEGLLKCSSVETAFNNLDFYISTARLRLSPYGNSEAVLPGCAEPTISGGPTSDSQGATFYYAGSNFAPNGTVTRYAKQPNGSTIELTPVISADSSGNISWSYTSVCGTPPGAYTITVKDNSTGKTSNTVNMMITANPICNPPALSIDGGTSSTKAQGGTYVFSGSNFTPNGTVTRYVKQPNGNIIGEPTPVVIANSSGNISWSYTSTCGIPTGTYMISVKDNATGKMSNTANMVVTANSICNPPALSIDGGTSSTKAQGGTFAFSGSKFTPNGTITRYAKQPDGNTIELTPVIFADSSGAINWSYTSACETVTGTYTISVKDNATGKISNTVNEVVTANTSCNPPALSIDGGTSSTKAQGGTFAFSGSKFTPNGTVTRYAKQPDGDTIELAPVIFADSSGAINWSYTSACETVTGTYTISVKDNATGKMSNTVREVVTANSSCSLPTLLVDGGTHSIKGQGDTFVFSGTNFTPNGTATIYVKYPNGSITEKTPSDPVPISGNISFPIHTYCDSEWGTYTISVKDNATGKMSNTVKALIVFNWGCIFNN